nr:JAB domain-containing protein [Tepidibacillus fermentans]
MAVALGAAANVVGHNHPSGDPTPSKEDISITQRLSQAGEILGIEVLDHIIIGNFTDRYVSLKEEGYI